MADAADVDVCLSFFTSSQFATFVDATSRANTNAPKMLCLNVLFLLTLREMFETQASGMCMCINSLAQST